MGARAAHVDLDEGLFGWRDRRARRGEVDAHGPPDRRGARRGPSNDDTAIGQVGVLCVDPTSPFSGGAILGDRVRMQDHALDERVFIRSLATRGHLGGLSIAVPDALALLGAAGFDLALIETVGVGQVELEVAGNGGRDGRRRHARLGRFDADGQGQAPLEVADIFVINKADRPGAAEAEPGPRPDARGSAPAATTAGCHRSSSTVATEGAGIDALFDAITAIRAHLHGERGARRRHVRTATLLRRLATATLASTIEGLTEAPFDAAVTAVAAGEVDPYAAVDGLLAT